MAYSMATFFTHIEAGGKPLKRFTLNSFIGKINMGTQKNRLLFNLLQIIVYTHTQKLHMHVCVFGAKLFIIAIME